MFTISGVWLVATVLLLLSLGMLAGYAMASIRARLDIGGRTPAELKQDFDQYQSKVDRHFETTNELLERMTAQYREVYAHMAASARELCSAPDARIDDHMRLIALEQMREEAEEAAIETPAHGGHAVTAITSAAALEADAGSQESGAADAEGAAGGDRDADRFVALSADGSEESHDGPNAALAAADPRVDTSAEAVVAEADDADAEDADAEDAVALVSSDDDDREVEGRHSPIVRAA